MFRLSEEGRHYLLALARRSIGEFLETRQKLALQSPLAEVVPNRGAFVTLHKSARLRGCIGYVAPLYPLYKTVIECSISAATQDPRFPSVQIDELPEIEIEISVLSPVEEVKILEDIKVGTHGLAISQKGKRGLLLPQVPVEYGWDRERFLEETCRKAGLPANAWREGAKIEYFTAVVFAEKEESAADPTQ